MKKLDESDLQPIEDYEKRRVVFRQHIIELKQARRVLIGSNVSVVFENRQTALFQIQEMLRAERITEPDLVKEELETYNELIPDANELRATLFIELPDQDTIEQDLPKFIGVEEQLSLRFGPHTIEAEAEPGRSTEEKTATVHYLKFHFSDEQVALFGTTPGQLVINHPNYQAKAELSEATLQSLARDLKEP